MRVPPEVIERIVDKLWVDFMIWVKTSLFLTLMLVNKSFYTILSRRRQELMRAHASTVHHCASYRTLLRFKKPLSNPFVNPRRLLDSMTRSGYQDPHQATPPVTEYVMRFVMENCDLYDSMMTTRSISVTFRSDDGKVSASWVKDMSLECCGFDDWLDDNLDELFKLYLSKDINVLSPDSKWVWNYAILFEPYLHPHHPVRIYPFGDTPRDFDPLEGHMFRGEDGN